MTQTLTKLPITPPVVHCTTMPEVRTQIDALDDVLVPLLVQRIGYMSQAARIKQDATQVRDEARIQAIVDRVRQQALVAGGEPAVVEAIYRGMMEACIAFEHLEFARLRKATSVGATIAAGPPQGESAPVRSDPSGSGGSAVRAAASVGAITP